MSTSTKYQFSPFKYFERNHISKRKIIILVILSVLMMVCGTIFNIYDWIQHPQFKEDLVTQSWFLDHVTGMQRFVFYAFFILDFFWAPLLLYIISIYIKTKAQASRQMWIYWFYIGIASIAIASDFTENFYYMIHNTYHATIVTTKIVAYSITLLVALLVGLRYSLKNRFVIFREFLVSSWISMIFLIIAGITLGKAPQLNSIIVDLYSKPFQFVIVLFLIFAPMYCIALSHYPNYILFSRPNRKFKDKVWKISKTWGIFGIIWYRNADNQGGNDYESYISFLRRTIGVFFYAAIFYMTAYTADTNFDLPIKFSGFTSALIVVLVWWLYVLKKKKDKWRYTYKKSLQKIDGQSYDMYITKDQKKETLTKPIHTYLVILVLTLVMHVVLLLLLYFSECPYNVTSVSVSLLCIALQGLTYTYYRTYRNLFKYAFFDKNNDTVINSFPLIHDEKDTRSRAEKKQFIIDSFEKNDFLTQSSILKKLSKWRIGKLSLGAASNNIIFLQIISYFGFFNALLLIYINIFPKAAMNVNSIIIIVSYFFLLYGAIVVILKHFIYYNLSEEKFALKYKRYFFFTISATILTLAIFNYLARSNEKTANNLYELTKIKETVSSDNINLKKYIKNLPEKRYYIGCYGGGMKANAWTMTVLNALDKEGTLYDKTICLSGASGGTIGLINYSAIKHQNDNIQFRDSIIRKIGTANILGMDLAHLLGRDWILHMFAPIELAGKDRSTSAMHRYAKYANSALTQVEFDSTSFRQQWYNMYSKRNKQNKHYPILISNTTNIKGRQGMAVSIPVKEGTAKDALYLGADDILELDNGKTLSFYNAASTTNRFPLISPAATIKGMGQFNDGGIYENSGLLSAYKLYEAINELDATANDKETVFINIINDKSAYVKFKMDSIMSVCKGDKINESNEISAILNSVAATEMFPGHVKDKLKLLEKKAKKHGKKFSFESIYLPHKFTMEDILTMYGPKIKYLSCVKDIDTMIKNNNDYIQGLLKDCSGKNQIAVEPAMSRVMAVQAFDFMQYMITHKDVKTVLDKLK